MTRSVTFGGQTQFRPGGLTRINAQGLTPVGASATGIVALLGEADGGQPRTVLTIDDPAEVQALLRSGPLADAVKIAFDPSSDPRVPGGAFRALLYKTNLSLQSATSLAGDEAVITDSSTGASTTTVLTLTAAGLVVDAHIGRWVLVNGERRRITDNDASTVTVSPALSAAPVNLDAVLILEDQLLLTSKDYGAHTNQIAVEFEAGTGETFVVTLTFEDVVEQSPEIAGESFLNLKYVGGAALLAAGNVTAIDPAGLDITTNLSAVAPNDAAGMTLQFEDGTQRDIASNTSVPGASVYTLSAGHALTAAQQTALATAGVTVRNVTTATGTLTGSNGVCTGMTTAVLPVADNLSLTWSTLGLTTLRDLVEYINGNTNYEATAPDGVNLDTTLLTSYDFGTRNTAVVVRFDSAVTPATAGSFRRDLQVVVDWINNYSTLASAAKATAAAGEGSELPSVTGGVVATARDVPVYFSGGSRGVSSNANWQDGFDALADYRANSIVPLISEDLTNEGNGSSATFATVAAQLAAHVNTMNSTGKNEMGGYIGMEGTRAELVAQIAALNNADVAVFGQKLTTLDASGNLAQQPEWSIAVAAAGMRSGVPEVGEPLTYKYIKTNALAQDTGWSPRSITDVNFLLERGLMFAEAVEGSGFRFVRDITSYLIDENIAYMDGNTRDAVRFVAYDLRTGLENQFTGLKATPANAASIKSFVISKMDIYQRDNIIVESLGPEAGDQQLYPGWRNLVVSITGNVATIRIEIFPVTGIVFQLNDVYLQLPRIVA